MEGHVKLTAAALLAIVFGVCAGVELTKVDAETVRPSTSAVTLSNLTDADRQVFYHLEEGSEVFPLDWILALRQKDTQQPFLQNAERFGLISDDDNPANPHHLPVGITAAPTRDLRVPGAKMVGVTCAACHVNQLTFKGKALRLDGAPSLFNIQKFFRELGDSALATAENPKEFVAFVERLKAIVTAEENRAGSRFSFRRWDGSSPETLLLLKARVAFLLNLAEMPKSTVPGFGRVDAFGNARNIVFPHDALPTLSPVSYPHLWGIDRLEWLHWDANTNSILERNIGQALGLGAVYEPITHASTIKVENLHTLELIARKIDPPKWPDDVFGKIDRKRFERGAKLFQKHCAACHVTTSGNIPDIRVSLARIGTDPNRAESFAQPVGNRRFDEAIADLLSRIKLKLYEDAHLSASQREAMEAGRKPKWRTTGEYACRPLVSVWATAPYLHNNSVPTLYDLLLPAAQRPKAFAVGHREYDPVKLGYVEAAASGDFIFDTAAPGNRNSGHEYGTGISESDRMALLEYLKGT
jgi:mono/diheme cytochrome c family protein